MERSSLPEEDILPSEEKSKKNKKFISFLAKFIRKDTTQDREDSTDIKISILEIIKAFTLKESNEDSTDEEDQFDDSAEDFNEFEGYIDDSLKTNLEIINSGELKQEDLDQIYIETVIISKIKDSLDKGADIEIDQIVADTAQEIEQQAESYVYRGDVIEEQTAVDDTNPDIRENDLEGRMIETARQNATPSHTNTHGNQVSRSKPMTISPSIPLKPNQNTAGSNNSGDRMVIGRPTPNTKSMNARPETSRPNQYLPNTLGSIARQEVKKLPKQTIKKPDIKKNSAPIIKSPSFRQLKNIEKTTSAIPAIKRNNEMPTHSINNSVLLDSEILRQAEKVYFDKVSMKNIYNNSDLQVGDLRRILSGESKKPLKKDLKRALARRKNNYSDVISSIKRPKSSFNRKAPQPNKQSQTPKNPVNQDSKPADSITPPKSSQKPPRPNKTNKPLLNIAVFIVIIIIVLLIILFR